MRLIPILFRGGPSPMDMETSERPNNKKKKLAILLIVLLAAVGVGVTQFMDQGALLDEAPLKPVKRANLASTEPPMEPPQQQPQEIQPIITDSQPVPQPPMPVAEPQQPPVAPAIAPEPMPVAKYAAKLGDIYDVKKNGGLRRRNVPEIRPGATYHPTKMTFPHKTWVVAGYDDPVQILRWTKIDGRGYVLETSHDPTFPDGATRAAWRKSPWFRGTFKVPGTFFFRVRGVNAKLELTEYSPPLKVVVQKQITLQQASQMRRDAEVSSPSSGATQKVLGFERTARKDGPKGKGSGLTTEETLPAEMYGENAPSDPTLVKWQELPKKDLDPFDDDPHDEEKVRLPAAQAPEK